MNIELIALNKKDYSATTKYIVYPTLLSTHYF